MKRLFNILPWSVVLLNLPCIYFLFEILLTDGGTWGFGWIVFPFLFGSSLFIIPALMKIKRKEDVGSLNTLNVIGLFLVLIILTKATMR